MNNTELYKLFHSNDSQRIHNELCLKVASKLLPYVQDVLKKAKEKGEIFIEDPESVAIMGLYGEIGMFITHGFTDENIIDKICSAWYKLLDL